MEDSRTSASVLCLVVLSVIFFSVSDIMSQPFTRFELVRDSKNLEFAAIGDPHYGWTHNQHAGDIVHSWMTNEAAPDISFAFNMGDYTHFGSPEGWKYAMQHSFNNMLLPWMMVFGNHDTDDYKTGTGRDLYGDAGGHASKDVNNTPYQAIIAGQRNSGLLSRNYAFSWNNILFLVFGDMGNTSLLAQSQRDWLEYMTSKYPDQTTITLSHQAPAGESTAPYRYYNNTHWWKNFIAHNPQIVLHINGHNHQFRHFQTFHGLDAVDVGRTNRDNKCVYFRITPHLIQARVWDVEKGTWENEPLLEKRVETHVQDTGLEWYSAVFPVQDGQKVTVQNKMLAKQYKLEIIGRKPELVEQNRQFNYWGAGSGGGPLQWIGYEQDADNGNHAGYVEFTGVDTFATATIPAMGFQSMDWYTKWIDGKVPWSTTPLAMPGKEYTLKVRVKADRDVGNAMDVGIEVLGQNLDNIIYKNPYVLKNLHLTMDYQWFEGNFIVPDNPDDWIIKTYWISKRNGVKYYLDEWSMTRADAGTDTKNFAVTLNGVTYKQNGDLYPLGAKEFDIKPETIKNTLEMSTQIQGSRTGFIQLIYGTPLLWSDDISIGVNKILNSEEYECQFDLVSDNTENISLSPLQSFVKVDDAPEYIVKDYYRAQTLQMEDVPGNFRVQAIPKLEEPDIRITAFEITPNTAEPGEPIQATFTLINQSQSIGTCHLVQIRNNLTIETQQVAMKAGQEKTIQLTLEYRTPGVYQIQAGSFTKEVHIQEKE